MRQPSPNRITRRGRRRRSGWRRVALAAIASVIGGRVHPPALPPPGAAPPASTALRETPGEALQVAGHATQDTVRVGASRATRRLAHGETVALQPVRRASSAPSPWRASRPPGSAPAGGRSATSGSAGATSTTSCPGSCSPSAPAAAALIDREPRARDGSWRSPSGSASGLTFDEAALLLDLRDVYWSREGLTQRPGQPRGW